MSEEIKNEVMSDVSTVEKKIESIVFNTLHEKIRGHIYVKMKEKVEETDIDKLFITINNSKYNINYTEELSLPGNTFEMVSQNDDYAKTLALMIFDNYKKYLDSKFYVLDRPRRYPYKKKFASREN